jgi:phage shock protein C
MRKLYRSQTDRMIAGICGGIGETYQVDSTLVRLGIVFLALITAIVPLVITYIIGWMIIPLKPPDSKVL